MRFSWSRGRTITVAEAPRPRTATPSAAVTVAVPVPVATAVAVPVSDDARSDRSSSPRLALAAGNPPRYRRRHAHPNRRRLHRPALLRQPRGVLLLDSFPEDAWLQKVAAEVNLSRRPSPTRCPPAARRTGPCAGSRRPPRSTCAVTPPWPPPTSCIPPAPRPAPSASRPAAESSAPPPRPTAPSPWTSDLAPHSRPRPGRPGEGARRRGRRRPRHRGPHRGPRRRAARRGRRPLPRPDLAALKTMSSRGTIVTAAAERPDSGYDFVSRGFFPAVGIDEDPVTGSAHTALAPTGRPGSAATS